MASLRLASPSEKQVTQAETVIVGAGPAGLAVAACLKRAGLPFILLEASDRVGSSWHRHYERLHLHTDKARSALPYLPFPKACPKYPSRAQMIAYLEGYAEHFRLRPRFHENVTLARFQDGQWLVYTADSLYASRHLVVATGSNNQPYIPTWPDQESFAGTIFHSSAYKSGAPFQNKKVLVAGFGNSGGEIAIDLYEHGAKPHLSVRGPVNIIPRDLLGVSMVATAIVLQKLPLKLADALTAPLGPLIFGDLSKLGLQKAEDGPLTQIHKRARIPLLDVGTVKLIREGHVKVRPGIERFTEKGVVFADGTEQHFDVVILATGYRSAVSFLENASAVIEGGTPRTSGKQTSLAGLYFCGFYVSPTGMLREIALEAKRIAHEISRKHA